MSGVVQHRSTAFSGNTGSLAFSSNVTAGNLIVVAVAEIEGETTAFTPSMVGDGSNTYSIATQFFNSGGLNSPNLLGIFYAVAKSSGPLTVSFNDPAGAPFEALHIYEISGGYRHVDQAGSANSNLGVSSSQVSTGSSTVFSNEFVLGFFYGSSGGAGNVVWTPQAGTEGTETTNAATGSISTFTEGFEVTSSGQITASVSINGGSSNAVPTAIIATFANAYAISGNAGIAASVFLSGDASRSIFAPSGAYSFLVAPGNYVITPVSAFDLTHGFLPSSRAEIVTTADIANVNFTAYAGVPTAYAAYQRYEGPQTTNPGTFLKQAFSNMGQQDLLQIVDPFGNVVFYVSHAPFAFPPPPPPTPTAVIGRFEARSGSDAPSYLASAFDNPNNYDIIQVVEPGGNVAFWVDYQGNVFSNLV